MSWAWHKMYSQLPGVVKAIVMTTFDGIFKHVVDVFVGFEQRTTAANAADSKMVKLVGFQFVSKFMYLFYFAFVMQDLEKLKKSLFTVLVASIVVQNVKEWCLPFVTSRWKKTRLLAHRRTVRAKDGGGGGGGGEKDVFVLRLTHMEEDYFKEDYDNTFEDYLEMLLQYGQIMLFAAVFPLGG
jgi:anoctamin-8